MGCVARPHARALHLPQRTQARDPSGIPQLCLRRVVWRSNRTANHVTCVELQVIAEEILPHVIFALFILLFIQIWYWSDDFVDDEGDDENDTRDEAPRHETERLKRDLVSRATPTCRGAPPLTHEHPFSGSKEASPDPNRAAATPPTRRHRADPAYDNARQQRKNDPEEPVFFFLD